jgi:hypothetical protein
MLIDYISRFRKQFELLWACWLLQLVMMNREMFVISMTIGVNMCRFRVQWFYQVDKIGVELKGIH